ncbi:MAG: YggS family pyridoxal phosphate-dependent enzyme [Clostridia bacterium]|nr:YggS family pyridoxal phosphate-dependent enzyme [Clostridia bacterium]
MQYLKQNLNAVQTALAAACGGEGPTVLAAVKYADDAELDALLSLGVREVGENRVQQLLAREAIYAAHGTRVHFIGSLQTNKVKYIADRVVMIHSVDSARLAAEIERQMARRNATMDVLVEINGANEESKSGVAPEQAEALARAVLACPHLVLRGFMTMGPRFETEQEYRAYFGGVRDFCQALWRTLDLPDRPLLSMGMSESFLAAAREGADFVRVGRRLFAKDETK